MLAGLAACRGRPDPTERPAAQRPAPPTPNEGGSGADLAPIIAGLATEEFNAELQFSPVTATWLGDHRFDDRLDDVRPEAVARELARLRALRDRVTQVMAALPPPPAEGEPHDPFFDPRVDLRLLADRIDLRLTEVGDNGPLYYMNLIAYGVDGMLTPEFLPVEALPLRVLARRLSQVPPLCQEAMRNLKNPPELATRKAIEVGQATLEFLSTLLPRLVRGVADTKALEEFRKSNDDARRALEDFVGFLNRELLPRSRGDYALGREQLQQRLRLAEQLDVPLDVVQAAGEREVRETRRRLEEVARRLTGSTGSTSGLRLLAEAQRALEEDHPRPEDLLQVATGIVTSVSDAVREQGLFPAPGELPRVEEMPPYRWGFAQLSAAGPLEAHPFAARFYVDPVDPAWEKDRKRVSEHLRSLNRSQLALTVLYAIVPGHYTQQAQQRLAAGALSATRQRMRSTAFIEGWPQYAADLLLQSPSGVLPERDRLLFLQWKNQLLHLGRLVVALRLHGVPPSPPGSPAASASQARIEDAARFLMDECLLDDYAAHREAERATYDPFFLLPALGRLQLAKLRQDYLDEQGEGATSQRFHLALLSHGELPVVTLRQLLLHHPGKSL